MNIKKREKYKRLIMGLISSVLIIFLLGSYACAWLTHYNLVLNSDRIQADHFGWKGNLLIFGVYVVLIFLFSRIYNGFRIGLLRVSDIIYSQCLSVLFINGITYVQICLLERSVADVLPMLWVTLADMAFIGIWAFCGNRIYSKLPNRLSSVSPYLFILVLCLIFYYSHSTLIGRTDHLTVSSQGF